MKILFLILALNLYSCRTDNQYQQSEEMYAVTKAVLDEFEGFDFILCSTPLSYSSNNIVTNSIPLKEALDIDLIKKFQEFSPPGDDILIDELINVEELEYMKNQIKVDSVWNVETLHFKVGNCVNNSAFNQLKLSKPLFNEENNLSLVFLAKSTITEYSVSLFLLKKEKDNWQKVWSINM